MEVPHPFELEVNGESITCTHFNTWLYSYTVEPYHNFILVETETQFIRIFNNPELHDRMFQANHNIVSEFEPNDLIREAWLATAHVNTEDLLGEIADYLKEETK